MKLSIKALSLTAAIFWSVAIFIVASANLMFPGYGNHFLEFVASIYPGYQPGTGMGSVIIGSLYGSVDGGIGGAIFAWLYNFFIK